MNELLFLKMDYRDYTSCVSQHYRKDHEVIEPYEEENFEALHQKIVVIPSPPLNSSPYDMIDSLNT